MSMTKIEKDPVSGSVELEDNNVLSLTAPGTEMVGVKMSRKPTFYFDVEQPNSQRRGRKTCSCGNKVASQGSVSFVNSSNNVAEWSVNPAEYKVSDSLGVSLFNVPLKLRSSGLFSEISKSQRRTKSVSDLSDFVLGYSAGSSSDNVIVSPSGRWLFDSIEGNLMVKALIKSSLIFQLDTLGRAVGGVGSRPSEFCNTCLQKPIYKDSHFGKQRSKSNVSDNIISCTSTRSSSSCGPSSSAECPVYKGMLHYVWKKGIRCFMFSADKDCGEVYVADPQKIEPSADQAIDYTYWFYSNIDVRKDARNKYNNASDFVGKMKVSSSLVLDSNRSRFMETEFVLYGAHDDHYREMQNSIPAIRRNKGLSEKVGKIFRSNHSFRQKSIHKVGEPSFRLEDSLSGSFSGLLNDIDKPASTKHSAFDFPSNLELAAVVVKDYRQYENKDVTLGGWGLKFLKEIEVDHADTEPSFASNVSKGSCIRRDFGRHMTVILPANLHGGPVSRNGGPSSLTERWRTGGRCDCGGWDIGCPLRVLENSTYSEAMAQEDSFEDCKSVSLFVEGASHDEPIMRMIHIKEGAYSIYFNSSLSALQSFSIGVAILHTETQDHCPKV